MATYMGGLLGRSSFNPELPPGLLALMAQPGRPAAQMAENMAVAGMAGQAGGTPPAAPPARPAAPPPMAAPPSAPPPASAGQNALMYGGISAMRAARPDGGGSLGAALGEGLASGALAFTATRDAERDRETALARQEQYRARIRSLPLPEEIKAGLIGMGAEDGSKMLAQFGIDVTKEAAKPFNLARGEQRRTASGALIAENVEPEKPFEADLSTDMADALFTVLGRNPTDRRSFLAPTTPEEAGRINQHLAAMANLRRNLTTITNIPPGQKSGIERAYELALTNLNEEFTSARVLPDRIRLYEDIIAQASSPGYRFGALAEVRQTAAKLARIAGLPVDVSRETETDVILSRLREAALLELPRLDSRPTDKDMEILLQKIGSLGTDPTALVQIARDNIEQARRGIAEYNRRLTSQANQFKDYAELPAYLEPVSVPETREQDTMRGEFGVPLIRGRRP